uniref:Uncharacterized protein MANES_16G083000 n=1 Tax=Rhizophora mucronata TaxID=61149 RepID=A0A2P2MVQ3_RHIMU
MSLKVRRKIWRLHSLSLLMLGDASLVGTSLLSRPHSRLHWMCHLIWWLFQICQSSMRR